MKISGAEVFVCCPGRNFVTLKVSTDQGVYGLGSLRSPWQPRCTLTFRSPISASRNTCATPRKQTSFFPTHIPLRMAICIRATPRDSGSISMRHSLKDSPTSGRTWQ